METHLLNLAAIESDAELFYQTGRQRYWALLDER